MTTPNAPISILDFLTELQAELDARDAELEARNERIALGRMHIHEALEMELQAEAAARGVDWLDLLATAVARCTANVTRH